MESIHAKKAKELFNEGYNCSQAVVGAFAEEKGTRKYQRNLSRRNT